MSFSIDPLSHAMVLTAIQDLRTNGQDSVTIEATFPEFISLAIVAMYGAQIAELSGPAKCQTINTISRMIATGHSGDPAIGEFLAKCWEQIMQEWGTKP